MVHEINSAPPVRERDAVGACGSAARPSGLAPLPAQASRLADPREHDDLLNYRLKRLVSIAGAPAVRLCEGRFGITRQEWRLLAALVEDGPMSPSQLADRAQLERGVASGRVGRLLVKQLVHRRALSGAGRRAELQATPAGRRLYGELFPLLADINRRLMAVLDSHEAMALEQALDKLTARARQIQREGGGVDVRADRRHGGSRRHWDAATFAAE